MTDTTDRIEPLDISQIIKRSLGETTIIMAGLMGAHAAGAYSFQSQGDALIAPVLIFALFLLIHLSGHYAVKTIDEIAQQADR